MLKEGRIKSKRLLQVGNFVYGKRIWILLIDCDKLLFLKKYKNSNNIINICGQDKRIYRLLFELIKFKIRYITSPHKKVPKLKKKKVK